MRRTSSVAAAVVGLATALSLSGPAPSLGSTGTSSSRTAARASTNNAPDGARATAVRLPGLRVTRVVGGLDIPWDVKPLPGGRLLITERTRKRLLVFQKGRLHRVRFPASTVWAGGETGLMGPAVDPGFSSNHRFYTCQGSPTSGGGHDVRVMAWRLSSNPLRATLVRRLLTGLPSTSGRHAGCRLLITKRGALVVGTGDAATGSNPRDLDSLGGKTLRLNRFSGAPWPANPFVSSSSPNRRYVLTYGQRNVQGLAQRVDGSLWSAEHGPDRDDEINHLVSGGDYGWNPVPGYDESVPMTDPTLPGTQVPARWRSGFPTKATSGIAWVKGRTWGGYRGTLAVAALKASRLMFLRFDRSGHFVWLRTPPRLTRFGRLRSVTTMPHGDLLVTTSNGGGRDSVLRVRPRR